MNRLPNLDSSWGIAVVRMIMGFVLIITGYEKLISGIQKVSAAMLRNRIPFPTAMAAYITGLELVGGFLLLIGLGGRWLTPLHWRIFGGELLHPSAHTRLDGCSPSDHVIGRRVDAVPVRLR